MAEIGLDLLRNSGEPRPRASRRTDVVTTVLSVWFVLGLFLDAYAHADAPELETFFTPWHAVFYSGFAATAAGCCGRCGGTSSGAGGGWPRCRRATG